jgi:hypothetical protein
MGWSNDKIRDLVIRTLVGEAARNDRDGMISVAHVLKNRADSGHYGDRTVNGLTNTIKAPLQFSMWNPDIESWGKTISPNDPYYQRAGAIADAVFNGEIPDNTGGADHYFAPGGMPGGRAPPWAIGQTPTATIGGQHFYKLGLGASDATNFGHTSAPAIGTPPLAPLGDAQPQAHAAIADALAAARRMLGKNEVPDHNEIMKYLHDGGQDLDPHKLAWCASFVSATLQKAGLPVPTQVAKGSLVGAGANARNYLTYGASVDDPQGIQAGDILVAKNGSHVGFAEGPMREGINGPEVQLLAGNESDNTGRYRPGSYTNPETGAVANRAQVGMVGERWVPLSDYIVRRAPTPAAVGAPAADVPAAQAQPAAAVGAPAADVPAAQAQPAAAVAPPGGPPIPGGGQSPSAGFVGPGSDKVTLVQGMTTGTSHNPQITTAANWGNLFGGGSSPTPPAAAPAAASTPVAQPATAPPSTPTPTPIDRNHPLPWPAPTPVATPSAPVSPLASVRPAWGADNSYGPGAAGIGLGGHMPVAGLVAGYTQATPGGPSMGFPAMTNPFGDQPPAEVSRIPGSMLASAQDLIRRLFPSSVG